MQTPTSPIRSLLPLPLYTRRTSKSPGCPQVVRKGLGKWVIFALALSSWMVPALPLLAQQELRVRFLDPRSEKPIRKLWVGVVQWNGMSPDEPILAKNVVSDLNTRTDQNGTVVVKLAEPLPKFVWVSSLALVSPGTPGIPVCDVLRSGVVLKYRDKSRTWTSELTGKPGEILIMDRRLTVWDRVRRELP